MEGLVIQTDQQEECDDADNLCERMGPEADTYSNQADADGLCRKKSSKQAEEPPGIGVVCKIQVQIFAEMVKHTVCPQLAALVAPQHAECAGHTAAVDDHGPHHPLGKAPVFSPGNKMDQRITNLLSQK